MSAVRTLAPLAAAAALTVLTVSQAAKIRGQLARLGPKWSKLHPEVKQRAFAVMVEASAEFADDGLIVGPFDGWRDISKQQREIDEGDSFIVSPLRSYHPWGLAVDFVFIDHRGNWTWLPDPTNPQNKSFFDPLWNRLGAIIERAGFEWGGRWKGRQRDGPHAQLPILRTAALIDNYGTPENWFAREGLA